MLDFGHDIDDVFEIKGRGMAYCSNKWRLPEGMWEPNDLAGETVMLAGVKVKILGVDAFCIARSPSSPYRLPFALLISYVDSERVSDRRFERVRP